MVSRSMLFLEVVHKLLEDELNIKVITEALNPREIKECLTEIRPEFLFLDSRTIRLNIHRLLNLITEKSPNTKVIVFGNHFENETNPPNVIPVTILTMSS